jgi:WXG100 family type VII secretion target
MAEIKMTAAQIRNTSQQMRANNDEANTVLDQITRSLAVLRKSQAWQSDAAVRFFAKYDELRDRIERHKPIINRYSDHLNRAVEDYQSTDRQVGQNADAINVKRA